jgi:hypothetical protein
MAISPLLLPEFPPFGISSEHVSKYSQKLGRRRKEETFLAASRSFVRFASPS